MKKQLLVAIAVLCMSSAAMSQTWTQVWNDEFNGPVLDQTKWNYEEGTGVNGDFGTGQLDRATSRLENVAIEQGVAGADGGALRISTRKEFYIDRNYTSGRINTKDKAFWGPNHRIVARVWPRGVRTMGQGFAFWMMPNEAPPGQPNISWPQGGEIDIMEYVGSIPSHNLGSVHYAWVYNNNEWADWNHGYQGSYYSFADNQVPDNPEWLRVDLEAVYNVNRLILNWENNGQNYKIETSLDGTTWSTAYTTSSGDGGIDNITFAERAARFIRISGTFRANDWGYSLYEVEVYGAGSSTNLALNRPANASSVQGNDVAARFAFDGNSASRWGSAVRNPQYQCCAQSSLTDPSVGANGWHTYGINWYSDRMEFFVDDNVYHVHYFNDGAAFDLDGQNQSAVQLINGRRVKKSEFSNLFPEWHPFEHKMFAILSAGVGGSGYTYGGPIVNEAVFPADVFIDWVRVYSNGQVFNPPPTVRLTAPTSIETYSAPANIQLAATASDFEGGSITQVDFYINGSTLIGSDTTAPYTFNWIGVPAGTYVVTAKATDNGGALSQSNAVTVTVNGPSSNLALNRPGTASTTTGSFVANNAFDASSTTRWESAYADPQWIYVDLGNTYFVNRVKITWETAMARDYRIEISSDKNNWSPLRSVTGNSSTINELTGLSGSGRYVRVYGTARTTSYGYSILSMEVYGNNNSGQAPSVSLTAPSNNSYFTTPATIALTANASDPDGAIQKVEFFFNNVNGPNLIGTATASPYTVTWSNVPNGTYSITAKATDNTGATALSAPITITVNPSSTNGNLALGKQATASSTVGGNIARNAVDGVATTRWESNYNNLEWIYVDLGATYNVNRVKITWENAYGKNYVVQTSASASGPWTNLRTVTNNTALVNDLTGLSGSGRYVRIAGSERGTGWGYSVFELEVYGTPGSSTGANIPGKIEAESYSSMSGVNTEPTTDVGGGLNVGWIDAGDWMDYNVNVTAAGIYTAQFRVAGWAAGAQLQLKNGSTILATVNIPNTGGGQTWQTVSANVALTAGAQTLRVEVATGGFNYNWVNFAQSAAPLSLQGETRSLMPFKFFGRAENTFDLNRINQNLSACISDI